MSKIALVLKKLFFITAVCMIRVCLRRKKKVWLIGENIGRLSYDNGYFFFKYSRRLNPKTFIVVSSDRCPAELVDHNILIYGSLRHAYYLSVSDLLIYTHSHRDVMYSSLYRIFRNSSQFVLLKHGITAMKKFNADYMKRNDDMDIFIVVSEHEKAIVYDNIGTQFKKIAPTGFARFDRYSPDLMRDKVEVRSILYMPTWRDWIDGSSFDTSALFERTTSLLNGGVLNALLRQNNCRLTFVLHINMRQYINAYHAVEHENIDIIFSADVRLQDLIVDHDLFLTDYSSVAWDFLYLKKPVIFYQFDLDDYLAKRGSYIDLRNSDDLFGRVVYREDDLLEILRETFASLYELRSADEKIRNLWFDYTDTKNCERIYNRVEELSSNDHSAVK